MKENPREIVVRETHQVELSKARELRYKILDRPYGLEPDPEVVTTDSDPSIIHVGAFLNGTMIATARVTPLDKTTYRIRRVAVESGYRGNGIGTAMIKLGENLAIARGAKRFVLDAQPGSEKFWGGLGYTPTKVVDYDGHTYQEMEKKL